MWRLFLGAAFSHGSFAADFFGRAKYSRQAGRVFYRTPAVLWRVAAGLSAAHLPTKLCQTKTALKVRFIRHAPMLA
jgi:hypothetical protein